MGQRTLSDVMGIRAREVNESWVEYMDIGYS